MQTARIRSERLAELAQQKWDDDAIGPEGPNPPEYYDYRRAREWLRGMLAGGLLALLAVIIIGSFVSLWFGWANSEEIDGILTQTLAPVVGLVGAATGFYFGGRVG